MTIQKLWNYCSLMTQRSDLPTMNLQKTSTNSQRLVYTRVIWMHRPDYYSGNVVWTALSGVVGWAGGGSAAAGSHAPHERPDLFKIRLIRRPSTAIIPILRLMLLQMPVKIRLLPKAAVTVTTPERPLFVMYISYVPLQIRRYRKGTLAVFTTIGLFPRVCP